RPEHLVPREHPVAVIGWRRIDLNVARGRALGGLPAGDGAAAGHLALRQQRVVGFGDRGRRSGDRRGHGTAEDRGAPRSQVCLHRIVPSGRSGGRYRPVPLTHGKSKVVRIPAGAATTGGIALTTRAAVATSPAWLWSPWGLLRRRSRV